ncbi:hypothetical protein ACQPZZ_28785 [Microbispora sp. CA-135349]|uniref:hypothetical protein n=1 Tax=Microbispora sp. CA-135349 TaxID=3239953 RepID=UPI003D89CB14
MLDDLQFFRTARALRVSPFLIDAADRIDAAFPDELCRQLLPLLSRLTGTADDGRNEDRVLMAQDWLARTCLPVWLRAAELGDDASRLRGLAPLRDAEGRGRMVEIAKEVGTRVGLGAPCRAEGFRLFSLAAAAAGHAESGTSPWRHVESADPDSVR